MRQNRTGDSRPVEHGMPPDMAADEALDWFLRLREDRAAETLAAFEAWRAADPSRAAAFALLAEMQAMPALRMATENDAVRLGLTPAHARPLASDGGRARRWIAAAAAIAAMLVVSAGWTQYPVLLLSLRADYSTEAGETKTVTLPDGSAVTLNTASAIAIDFEGNRRRIAILTGEAFFDVRPDSARPFVVVARHSEVEVLGTAFDVRTDAEGDTVVLEHGSVTVALLAGRSNPAQLKPGQMIVASAAGLSPMRDADIGRSLAWRDGRIVFYDRPFRRALADLERYYRGSVVVMNGEVSGRVVSGNYRVDDPEAAIRTLARSAGVSVTRLPGGVLLLH